MSSNFLKNIPITIFGESHGHAIGATISNLPPGISFDFQEIEALIQKRSPKTNYNTSRLEKNSFEIVSGYYNNHTTGSPLTFIIMNNNQESKDYQQGNCRPSHADYSANLKYDGYQDYRGGGHFSGRLTLSLVICGAMAKQVIQKKYPNLEIYTRIKQVLNYHDDDISQDYSKIKTSLTNRLPICNKIMVDKVEQLLENTAKNGDSLGAMLETVILNCPSKLGEPMFDGFESILAHGLYAIPAVKGVTFGAGVDYLSGYGSSLNDQFIDGQQVMLTNNNDGGINGGITNGLMPVVFQTIIKPTPTIFKPQSYYNYQTKKTTKTTITGRHDAFIANRALYAVDAITYLVVLELMMEDTKWNL